MTNTERAQDFACQYVAFALDNLSKYADLETVTQTYLRYLEYDLEFTEWRDRAVQLYRAYMSQAAQGLEQRVLVRWYVGH